MPRPEPDFEQAPVRGPREQRLYGLNACLAMFARRPGDLRKVWLLESRIPQFKAVLAHCVKHRIGYTVVDEADKIQRLIDDLEKQYQDLTTPRPE